MMSALAQDLIQAPPVRGRILTRRDGLAIVRRFLRELEQQSLEVVLIPSKHWGIAGQGGRIRAVQTENPEWYQEFCGLYEARRGRYQAKCDHCGGIHDARKNKRCLRRKRVTVYTRRRKRLFDTAIKRQDTIRGLKELLSSRCESEYAHRLRDFIRRNWIQYL